MLLFGRSNVRHVSSRSVNKDERVGDRFLPFAINGLKLSLMTDRLLQQILATIRETTGAAPAANPPRSVSGGCINQGWHLGNGEGGYFVKTNDERFLKIFEAEAEALAQLAATNTIRIPRPIFLGHAEGKAFLVLEWLDLCAQGNWAALGEQLAKLHRATSPNENFGWDGDNVIGETPQPNPWTTDWTSFFLEHRLLHQIRLCSKKGLRLDGVDKLLEKVPDILNHRPAPSLLHGDLWGGNVSFLADGRPTIFDPATYYGDREVDLAFTEMFGRMDSKFYEAYQSEWPVPPGYSTRKRLYNLYHELNHFYLFGGIYGRQAQQSIEWLNLSEV
tara:strand:+ start:7938 stop:8933 length:996 start_codon:yes stop_codon:yes gene_type:complete